ncbi:MAG: long-chain-acyl-CoA synthetase [Deltaproteobacteria bacterium]|nr:long-chain-acyl-CoA synthetase [Deltaproteobacteria bacterium]
MRDTLADKIIKVLQAIFSNLNSNETIALQFERLAKESPEHPFLLFEDRRYSYVQSNALANRHAHAYAALGVKKGDVVALVLENRPEFLWHFLGLNKIGAVASLINSNISGDLLAHALRACRPARIVVGSEVWENFAAVRATHADLRETPVDVDLDLAGATSPEAAIWADRLCGASETNPIESGRQRLLDGCALIYTSGTTGMPKPAIVNNCRIYRAGRLWSALAFRLRTSDILYNCLPLYHANAILLATGSVITSGATLALARKFSPKRFWDDIRAHRATSFVYIGELCRYLMNLPPGPGDRNHNVRVISGNGLRNDIWQQFQERFGIERISEFYASTEGNAIAINTSNKPGSVGLMLPNVALVKWDNARQDFVRDAKGFLIKCKTDEAGVLIGRIRQSRRIGKFTTPVSYEGYLDDEATRRRIVRDVFRKGDAWFNTADLLRRDKFKHLYFVDRLGDTFRWKGENVSTFEVQEQIAKWDAIKQVNVYGVQIPGAEGRAGMASIVLSNAHGFNPDGFKSHVDAVLPSYARPLFVRLSNRIETTSTLKMKKIALQKQGFDPDAIGEHVYFRHPDRDEYIRMTREIYRDICARRLRV